MYSIFKQLADLKGVKLSTIAKETGINLSTFTDWKAGRYTPKSDKMQKIADYFHVSVEYLTTGKDTEKESESGEKYYFSDETAAVAQELFENRELRILFDTVRNADAEDLKALQTMALALKRKERGE